MEVFLINFVVTLFEGFEMKNKKDDEKKKVAIYCRVSTYMQGAADYSSLDAQEDQLKAFCKGKGWDIYKIYRDTKTGSTLERDELQNLFRKVRR